MYIGIVKKYKNYNTKLTAKNFFFKKKPQNNTKIKTLIKHAFRERLFQLGKSCYETFRLSARTSSGQTLV